MLQEEIVQAIKLINDFSKTHEQWAIYFEENPDIEEGYIKTGNWDSALKHREIVIQYNNIIRLLIVLYNLIDNIGV